MMTTYHTWLGAIRNFRTSKEGMQQFFRRGLLVMHFEVGYIWQQLGGLLQLAQADSKIGVSEQRCSAGSCMDTSMLAG